MKLNLGTLCYTGVSSKEVDKLDMRVFKKVSEDFNTLRNMWSKAFLIFLMERSEDSKLSACAKKLHLEIKYKESDVYERYFRPFMRELKKEFLSYSYGGTKSQIVDSLVNYGDLEYVILNRVIFNSTPSLYNKDFLTLDSSLPRTLLNQIETKYYAY